MLFTDSFSAFYEQFKTSLTDGTFAKLTFAKTIGKTELKNIFIRPILEENELKLELKFRFQREELFEIHTINSAFDRLLPFINNPFLSVILFATEFDLTYKLNKKRMVNVIDKPPTFGNANEVLLAFLNKWN
ncbi:hypothetical protein EQG68_04640 [Flavobacterium piscinae]|uniref:Uncharacterized protein n=1 Tax=Flavobacterium piscinae TaxID=2506424 RepID=A0A4Q1KTM0_9FLAO|nr:hypothetical protein [Flavobacterium piscinae]RXR33521.1 hypothetical protein EQG68_04640 [Flavobacterium piscinae]